MKCYTQHREALNRPRRIKIRIACVSVSNNVYTTYGNVMRVHAFLHFSMFHSKQTLAPHQSQHLSIASYYLTHPVKVSVFMEIIIISINYFLIVGRSHINVAYCIM